MTMLSLCHHVADTLTTTKSLKEGGEFILSPAIGACPCALEVTGSGYQVGFAWISIAFLPLSAVHLIVPPPPWLSIRQIQGDFAESH